jgi:YD repeat-containing protein
MVTGAGTTQYAVACPERSRRDAADRLTSVTPPGQSAIGYVWDDNGNLTSRGSDAFSWDAEDRSVRDSEPIGS